MQRRVGVMSNLQWVETTYRMADEYETFWCTAKNTFGEIDQSRLSQIFGIPTGGSLRAPAFSWSAFGHSFRHGSRTYR